MTLLSNGEFEYNYYGEGSFGRTGKGNYSYNKKQEMLVLTYTSMDRTDLYIVQTQTSKSLILLDPEDLYVWSFTKQNPGNNEDKNNADKNNADKENTNTNKINGHEYVDLGLSVKWATCNVGANSPSDYGDYFAWGETTPKNDYSWDTYIWHNGTQITKYCTDNEDGTVDNKKELLPIDDVATIKWGNKWRIPTLEEMEELAKECIWTWTIQNGHKGYMITGTTGNSIFLPATGVRRGTQTNNIGSESFYWSSTLLDEYNYSAYYLCIGEWEWGTIYDNRCIGRSIRPVTE